MSFNTLPGEILFEIAGYIGEPAGFFAFKSTTSEAHAVIPGVFVITDILDIVDLSLSIPEDRVPLFHKLKINQTPTARLLWYLELRGVSCELIALAAAFSPDSEINNLIRRDPSLARDICVSACLMRNFPFVFDLLTRMEKINGGIDMGLVNPVLMMHSFAVHAGDDQLHWLLKTFPNTFTPTLASTIINLLIKKSHVKTIKYLHYRGFNFKRSYGGEYPVQAAVESGRPETLRLILSLQGNMKLRYRHGKQHPLLLAINREEPNMVLDLLKFGFNAEVRDFYGNTASQIVRNRIQTIERCNLKSTDLYERLLKLHQIRAHLSS